MKGLKSWIGSGYSLFASIASPFRGKLFVVKTLIRNGRPFLIKGVRIRVKTNATQETGGPLLLYNPSFSREHHQGSHSSEQAAGDYGVT